MTNLDFTEVRPDTHSTTPEERLTAFLFRDLCRQFPDDKDTHFRVMAADLAAELSTIASSYRREDYRLSLRRPRTTTVELDQLADHN